ncbi:MAG: DNA-protecting protein DprA [Candidatus Moranbacteria bacterium CG_4_9_14_3_um_filter_40_7]|nr:MAG: DNA-protecting protein DprA [Candidatus Moranbacteria bacterium CG23_combo_of_CG06-09_8_20_14_all_40_16]PIU80552.1 MAG: DNA-protecting protein DprA [Candidatus Moranbacteria bacterium CG06_land_8_20_14_3_00_40_12]PJA87758.1 MAG: DNA-protecting protein DprA [Candidatus Moranbacteria bacterium CG_4_9_14_3_um_filter_40_7]
MTKNKLKMKYLNALNKINGLGPQKIKKLLGFFGKAENAWNAGWENLEQSGIGPTLVQKIIRERKLINPKEEWGKLEKENIVLLTPADPDYPRLLKEINGAPFILYKKGGLDLNAAPLLSIVGSRKFTAYGKQVAISLAKDLAQSGFVIVSGLALGIDSIAHRSVLENGGKTIAILGNSLDEKSIYPSSHLELAREIGEKGAVLSDYPIETPAGEFTFPARNRLIAGISLGTLIIEAGEKSGSLITASLALEFNREVFSVPGSIFSAQSIGTNQLLKKGAKLVMGVKDILEELNLEERSGIKNIPLKIPSNQQEEILLKILSSEPLHIDNLSRISKLGTASISAALSMMEIKGWIKDIGGQNYIIL